MSIQTARLDHVLSVALLPYLAFLVRRSVTVGDAVEIGMLALLQARLLLSVTRQLPMTPFENSAGGAATAMAVMVGLNVLVALVPAMRRKVS